MYLLGFVFSHIFAVFILYSHNHDPLTFLIILADDFALSQLKCMVLYFPIASWLNKIKLLKEKPTLFGFISLNNFWIGLWADVDLATNHFCFSKSHSLFPPRKKGHTTRKYSKRAVHQTHYSVLNYKSFTFVSRLLLIVLAPLEVWKFSEVLSAKFIAWSYEQVYAYSQGMLCMTCSIELEIGQFKGPINMEWFHPEGRMNVLRDLPC